MTPAHAGGHAAAIAAATAYMLKFHATFAAIAMAVLTKKLDDPAISSGIAVLTLVALYSVTFLCTCNRDHTKLHSQFTFAATLSVFQVVPDLFLDAVLGTLHFPEDGCPRLFGHVSLYMAGMWTIPILWILWWSDDACCSSSSSSSSSVCSVGGGGGITSGSGSDCSSGILPAPAPPPPPEEQEPLEELQQQLSQLPPPPPPSDRGTEGESETECGVLPPAEPSYPHPEEEAQKQRRQGAYSIPTMVTPPVPTQAELIKAAAAGLVIFGSAEQLTHPLGLWCATEKVRYTVGNVALYVLIPEALLGCAALFMFRVTEHPPFNRMQHKVAAAASASLFYTGSLAVSFLFTEHLLREYLSDAR